MSVITNHTIVNFFDKEENEDIKKNIGIFPSNFNNRLINFHTFVKKKDNFGYPFIIMITDKQTKRHTWVESFRNIHPKKRIFLFDSFGLQDNKNIINKIMYNIKQIYRIDDKITLISVTFSTNEYEKKSELSTGCN